MTARLMHLETAVMAAGSRSKSLRVTIPEGIVAYLGLSAKDKVRWSMEFKDEERVVEIRKVEKD